jgi:hypothetical protein
MAELGQSTPRTLEACKRAGFELRELIPKSLNDFYIPGDFLERQKLRFNHFEERRQQKLALVLAERNKILETKVNESSFYAPAQNLTIMETLIGKEARRLEKDLKAQLRFYETVEKDNSDQLTKEAKLKDLVARRSERVSKIVSLKKVKKEELKAKNAQKEKVHAVRYVETQSEKNNRRKAFFKHLMKDMQRFQQWESEKAQKPRETQMKISKGGSHVKSFHDKVTAMLAENDSRRKLLIEKHANKVFLHKKKVEEENFQKLLKHENITIKLIDAKENRDRKARAEEVKREEVRKMLEEEVMRVNTLLLTKEQLLKQRQQIVRDQESVRGKPINIKLLGPGPADYSKHSEDLFNVPAPVISDVKPKLHMVQGTIDFELARSSDIPGVGEYSVAGELDTKGVAIGKGEKKTYLDQAERQSVILPGPGAYLDIESRHESLGVPKISRVYYPYAPAVAEHSPGPAAYSVDAFMRKEGSKNEQSILPHLRQALAMKQIKHVN